jgi:hypothetical protein
MKKLSANDVIKILAETTSGSANSSSNSMEQNTQSGQNPGQQKEVNQDQLKKLVQEAINNIGKQLNITPEQVPDFNKKFQDEIQRQLTELQNRAKNQQNMLG